MVIRSQVAGAALLGLCPMVVLSAVAPAAAWAAPRAFLSVPVEKMAVGQALTLQLMVVDGRIHRGRPPVLAMPDGLEARFVSQRSEMKSVNFQITEIYAFQYQLIAREEGRWEIPAIDLRLIDGTALSTRPLTIEVVAADERQTEGPKARADARFLPEKAWEGQVVLYVHEFEGRGPIGGVKWRLPELQGLRAPQHGRRVEQTYTLEDPSGPITISRGYLPLVATSTGEREHDGALAVAEVRTGRQNLLGFSQIRQERISTPGRTLTVRGLPPHDGAFTGLVGEFGFRASFDRAEARVGQSVKWTLEVAGDGTLEGFNWVPSSVDGATVYPGDVERTARVEDGEYLAIASIQNVLVPTRPGPLVIPPVELVTFSPERGDYRRHEVEVPTLMVRPGGAAGAKLESFSSEPSSMDPGLDFDPGFRDNYRWGFATRWFLGPLLPPLVGVAALPGALAVGFLVATGLAARRRRERRITPLTAMDVLATLPDGGQERLKALDAALRIALATRLGEPVATLDRELGLDALGDASLATRLRLAFQVLDRARFAGSQPEVDPAVEVRALVARLGAR